VRRWKAELELSATQEKDWRKEADNIWKKYKAEAAKAGILDDDEASFNVLWSNTEILVPALYNSTPTPDVRRRFKDKDPIGKLAATVLERGLTYAIDSYDFDSELELSVLDYTLVGRGLSRIRYLPQVEGGDEESEDSGDEYQDKAEGLPEGGEQEESQEPARITAQDTTCEQVKWDDFRRGPGRKWSEVPWIAFRHRMTYDDLVYHFKEDAAKKVPLDQTADDEDKDSDVKRLFQTGEVWEIWDKLKRRVLFVSTGVEEPLRTDDDPTLQLKGFFPMPRPMMATLDSTSLIPIPLYRQYKTHAEEIDRITRRIKKITQALRLRGLYVSNLPEAQRLLEAGDNEMVPIEDAAGLATVGLDKMIWIMPVDKLVAVLEALYKSREQTKQTIYEIIGLSDIMRGATKATETLGAQELKSRWGSVRLQRMQKEVQRFVRDILRLKGEVIAEHYEPELLSEMTQIKLPTAEQKKALQEQIQRVTQAAEQATMAAEQAQQEPPQPPPIPPEMQELLNSPTWDDVIGVLRSDAMRTFRVAIESDSTIASMVESDMQGNREVVETLGAVFASIPTLQQAGAQNAAEVVKEIALALIRHSRFGGRLVEDSIEDLEFADGGSAMDQIKGMLEQLGQQVQEGAQAVGEMGQKQQQHTEIIGQIISTMQAQPQQQPQGQLQPQQPVRAV
jgi:hypothetical protein